MDTLIWIAQIVLALLFFMAGIMKVTQPIDKLQVRMSWIEFASIRAASCG